MKRFVFLAAGLLCTLAFAAQAGAAPSVVDPNLGVRTAASGLVTPTSLAFLGPNDMLVVEKQTGRVQRVVNGAVAGTAIDLAVNNNSERGLLGIALHPSFPVVPWVYLYWTCKSTLPQDVDPFRPEEQRCSDDPAAMLGADTDDILQVPLLGNRVDRFRWNGTTLTYDRNLIQLRAFQNDGAPEPPGQGDAAQPARANHDGGVIDFGPDGKLYIQIGDVGRRGQLQNLPCGPTATQCPGPITQDDQFGGPQPDNAHLTGGFLRLNDDGTTPTDNPFFAAGSAVGGEVGANIQKLFAYGVRNAFGFDFDPVSGALWEEQNGDDSFTEINRVESGQNLGWVQIMGPVERLAQFKSIETSPQFSGLQQLRWPPTNIADSPAEALGRLFMVPGAQYSDPEFSWKFEVAPAGVGFLRGRALGPQYQNDLFVGAARTTLEGGQLWHFSLTGNRRKIGVDDPRLDDRVADNLAKFDITESESLLFGRNFGVGTDIETGPNGNLYVVSLDQGAVYEIFRTK
ncbi:MAG TPA: PQQ-dependent sugar dehydrogenase [Gaiellaceae bacterium]|nr:PQQ-dependent sugar dehydrogenase [Gaiellaceae bacterium]